MHALVCPLCRIALSPTDSVCPRDGHAAREVAWLSVPPALGQRFQTLQPFAHGDSGSLYIADEPETGRRGLLKILAPVAKEQSAERQRLRRELVKQATLARTHLVVPLASGDADGATWVFREWLEGVTLEVRLSRGGPLPQVEALAIAAQVASALDELHRGGLLHRDVKPGHVFLQSTHHGLPRVLLLDAGIATPIPLRSGVIYGTPGYVAPEQLLGNLVSFRSDLYALGSVLYRMLTGRPAFEAPSDAQTLEAQRSGMLPPVPPSLPPGIRQLLQSLLAREPQERPFSAQKLRRTLEPFLPDDALIERNPTSSFEMPPAGSKPPAVLASGTLRPPPPPGARTSLSGTVLGPAMGAASTPPAMGATSATPAPARVEPPTGERTDQLELDQVEEALRARAQPPPPPGTQPPSDKTQPIRLDQILAVADGRRAASRPPPARVEPPREDATLVDPPRDLEGPAPGAAFERPQAVAAADFRPRDEPGASPRGATDFRPGEEAPPSAEPRAPDDAALSPARQAPDAFRPRDEDAAAAPSFRPPDQDAAAAPAFRPRDAAPRRDDEPGPSAGSGAADVSGRGTVRGLAPVVPTPDSADQTIEVDALARAVADHERDGGAQAPPPGPPLSAGKRTLVGLGVGPLRDPAGSLDASGAGATSPSALVARSTAPGEPAPRFASPRSTLPLGTALPSAAALHELDAPGAPAAGSPPGGSTPSSGAEAPSGMHPPPAQRRSVGGLPRERDIPTEPIPVHTEDSARAHLPAPWWLLGGDRRRALMYGSAALVGLAVLGVGVSALFAGGSAPPREASHRQIAAPALPTVAAVARREEPPAEPAPEPEPAASPPREKKPTRTADPTPAPARAARPAPSAKREAPRPPSSRAAAGKPAASRPAASKPPPIKEGPTSKPKEPDNAALFAAARDEARAAYSAKRFKDAAAAYERATRYDPGHAGTFAGLGAARLQLGDEKGAVQAYQRAVQLSPTTSGFHAALGRAYLSLGDTARARAAYKQALALDPKNQAAKEALKSL